MSAGDVQEILRNAIMIMLQLAAPFLIVSIIIGLVISIFQAATQIHEQTITFVPKVVAIVLLLLILGSWMISKLSDLFDALFSFMINL